MKFLLDLLVRDCHERFKVAKPLGAGTGSLYRPLDVTNSRFIRKFLGAEASPILCSIQSIQSILG